MFVLWQFQRRQNTKTKIRSLLLETDATLKTDIPSIKTDKNQYQIEKKKDDILIFDISKTDISKPDAQTVIQEHIYSLCQRGPRNGSWQWEKII